MDFLTEAFMPSKETMKKYPPPPLNPHGFPLMREVVPEGESGQVKIIHFTVSEEEAERTVAANRARAIYWGGGDPYAYVPPGDYVKMVFTEDKELMMSDTLMERRTCKPALDAAKGDCIVFGLGLGMVTLAMCRKPEVKSVCVIEKSPDVIKLVHPYVEHEKMVVIEADAFEYRTHAKFDTIWFDIWPRRSVKNLPDIAKLHQRWKCRKKPGGWMQSWYADELRTMRRQGYC